MAAFLSQDDTASKGSSNHLGLFTGIFVILIIAMLVMLSSTGIQFRRNAQMFEDIREQQFVAQQIITDIAAVSENQIQGFDSLKIHDEQFDRLIIKIRDDLGKKGLAAQPDLIQAIQNVEEIWQDYRPGITAVLSGEQSMRALMAMLDIIQEKIPKILLSSEEIVRLLIENNAAPEDVYIAARQMALIQRIANGMYEAGRAGTIVDEQRLQTYSTIARDSGLYEQTLRQMLGMELDKPGDSMARDKLLEISSDYKNISQSIEGILGLGFRLANFNSAVQDIEQKKPQFIQTCESLSKIYSELGQRRDISTIVWSMLLVGLVVLVGLIIIQARSAARNKSNVLYEVNPQDLVDYLSDEVKDIVKGNTGARGKDPDRLPSSYLEGMDNALKPLRVRAEFVNQAITKILSISNQMHQSVANIVDASDRMAQQTNRATSMIENIVVSMRRAANDVASSMSMANRMLADAETSREPALGKIFGEEVRHLGGHVMEIKSAIINLGNSTPDISAVAERIGSTASKINLLALNTAVHAGENDEVMRDLFAADEIQQNAHHIAGMTRHMTELGDTINATISSITAQVESISNIVNVVRTLDQEKDASRKQPDKNTEKLLEKIRNVMVITEQQFNSASKISSSLGTVQETIVELSADVNDIMTCVEGLEKVSGELRRSNDR